MQFYNAKIFSVVGSKKSPWLNSAPPILKFIKYKQLSDTFQLSILLVNNTESYTFLCITNTAWVQYGHLEIVALTLLDKKWLLYDAKAEIFQYSLSTMLPFRFLLFGGPSSWRQWPTAPTLSPMGSSSISCGPIGIISTSCWPLRQVLLIKPINDNHWWIESGSQRNVNFTNCKMGDGSRHSSVDLSAPAIQRPRVWSPTTSTYAFSSYIWFVMRKGQKEARIWPIFKKCQNSWNINSLK